MNEEANVATATPSEDTGYTGEYSESGNYSEPQQQAPQQTQEPAPTASNGEASTFAIRVDPRTGRREIVSVGSADNGNDTTNGVETTQPAIPQQATTQAQPMQQQPAQQNTGIQLNIPQNIAQQQKLPNYANAGEVIAALNAGTLDESRIPVEMAFQYAQFKQQLAQQQTINNQKAIEAQQQPQQQTITPEMAQARQEYFTKVNEIAREKALADIGLTADELATAEYSDDPSIQQRASMYETALQMHRNSIMQAVQAERQKQVNAELAQRAVITNVNAHINQLAKTEPQFQAIMQNMGTFFKDKSIPFDDGVRYLLAMNAYNSGSMTDQQALDMQEYYNKVRTAHYAKMNGIGQQRKQPRSPYVEGSASSGNMQNSGTDRQNLLKQLRNATDYRVKRELMGKLLGK